MLHEALAPREADSTCCSKVEACWQRWRDESISLCNFYIPIWEEESNELKVLLAEDNAPLVLVPAWAFSQKSKVAYAKWLERDISERRGNIIGNFCPQAHGWSFLAFLYCAVAKVVTVAVAAQEDYLTAREDGHDFGVQVALFSTAFVLLLQTIIMRDCLVPWKGAARSAQPFKAPIPCCDVDIGFVLWFIYHALATFLGMFFKFTTLSKAGKHLVRGEFFFIRGSLLVLLGESLLDMHSLLHSCPSCFQLDDDDDDHKGHQQYPMQWEPCNERDLAEEEVSEKKFCTWAEHLGFTDWCSTHFESVGRYGRSSCMNMAVDMSMNFPLEQLTQIRASLRNQDPLRSAGTELRMKTACVRRGQMVVRESIAVIWFQSVFSTIPKLGLMVLTYHQKLASEGPLNGDHSFQEQDRMMLIVSVICGYVTFILLEVLPNVAAVRESMSKVPDINVAGIDEVVSANPGLSKVGLEFIETLHSLKGQVTLFYVGFVLCMGGFLVCCVETTLRFPLHGLAMINHSG